MTHFTSYPNHFIPSYIFPQLSNISFFPFFPSHSPLLTQLDTSSPQTLPPPTRHSPFPFPSLRRLNLHPTSCILHRRGVSTCFFRVSSLASHQESNPSHLALFDHPPSSFVASGETLEEPYRIPTQCKLLWRRSLDTALDHMALVKLTGAAQRVSSKLTAPQ